jgi:two-component sensor histidine kinase
MPSNDEILRSVERLAALRKTGLLDTPGEPAFDRVTGFATRLLGAPVSLMSLVDEDRQFFKSAAGLPDHLSSVRETPLTHSFCQHVVATAKPLIVEDARLHPLVKDNPAVSELGVIGYLGIPLTTPDGMTIGSLCAIDTKPHTWTDDDVQRMSELAGIVMSEIALRDEIAKRNRAEEHQKFLVGELTHRVINTFALVDSIIGVSLRTSEDLASFGSAVRDRIKSLAATHALVADQTKETIKLEELVSAEITPLTHDNISVGGPSVSLSINAALYLSMGLHELLTNSVKYGALSVPQGKVTVTWHLQTQDDLEYAVLLWHERNGPPVSDPTRQGFGTLLFERVLGQQLQGVTTRQFDKDGVSARIEIRL